MCATTRHLQRPYPLIPVLYRLYTGEANEPSSAAALAEQLSAVLRSRSSPEQRGRAPASLESLRAQLLAIGSKLFEHGQLGLAPRLAALAGPLQADPVLQFLQVREPPLLQTPSLCVTQCLGG